MHTNRDQLYEIQSLDNAEEKAKEWSLSVLYKIKFKGLLKKLPQKQQPGNNDTNDIDTKEQSEMDISIEGNEPGMPPPAPVDATPGMWSGSPSPKIGASSAPGMPPPNPIENNTSQQPPPVHPVLELSQSSTEASPQPQSQQQPPPNPVMQQNHSYHAPSPRKAQSISTSTSTSISTTTVSSNNAVRKQNHSFSSVKSAPPSGLRRVDSRPPPPARRGTGNRAKKWPPVGHTNEYKDNGNNTLKGDLNILKRKLVDFGKKYTETEILSMYNDDKGSIMVEKEIDELETRIKATMDQLKCLKTQIIKLKVSNGVDVSQYESWSIDEMVVWICGLHNGRFKKYADKIRKGFTHNEISGAHMTLMNSSAIHEVCGITHWKDRNDLAECFSSLKAKK